MILSIKWRGHGAGGPSRPVFLKTSFADRSSHPDLEIALHELIPKSKNAYIYIYI